MTTPVEAFVAIFSGVVVVMTLWFRWREDPAAFLRDPGLAPVEEDQVDAAELWED